MDQDQGGSEAWCICRELEEHTSRLTKVNRLEVVAILRRSDMQALDQRLFSPVQLLLVPRDAKSYMVYRAHGDAPMTFFGSDDDIDSRGGPAVGCVESMPPARRLISRTAASLDCFLFLGIRHSPGPDTRPKSVS